MNEMRKAIRESARGPAQIHEQGGEQVFFFASSFPGFEGHFPGYPILPGFMQLLLAQVVAEEVMGRPLEFKGLVRVKFVRQLRPEEPICVALTHKEKDGQQHCRVQLKVADEQASSFTLILAEA